MAWNQYLKAHNWIHGNYVKANICEQCSKRAKTEWSNTSGEYRMDRNDWRELCRKCHAQYDRQPHMRGASYRAGMAKRDLWQVENVDEETKRKLKGYAGSHGLTLAEALKVIVSEWKAARSNERSDLK